MCVFREEEGGGSKWVLGLRRGWGVRDRGYVRGSWCGVGVLGISAG